jgi:hypothetical protein
VSGKWLDDPPVFTGGSVGMNRCEAMRNSRVDAIVLNTIPAHAYRAMGTPSTVFSAIFISPPLNP